MPIWNRRVSLDDRTAQHVIAAVQRLEAMPYPSRQWIPPLGVAPPALGTLAVANGTIQPRVGNNSGNGNVVLWTSTNGALVTQNDSNGSPIVLGVYNFSSTNGGIPNGTFCIVQYLQGGDPYVWSLDCGN